MKCLPALFLFIWAWPQNVFGKEPFPGQYTEKGSFYRDEFVFTEKERRADWKRFDTIFYGGFINAFPMMAGVGLGLNDKKWLIASLGIGQVYLPDLLPLNLPYPIGGRGIAADLRYFLWKTSIYLGGVVGYSQLTATGTKEFTFAKTNGVVNWLGLLDMSYAAPLLGYEQYVSKRLSLRIGIGFPLWMQPELTLTGQTAEGDVDEQIAGNEELMALKDSTEEAIRNEIVGASIPIIAIMAGWHIDWF